MDFEQHLVSLVLQLLQLVGSDRATEAGAWLPYPFNAHGKGNPPRILRMSLTNSLQIRPNRMLLRRDVQDRAAGKLARLPMSTQVASVDVSVRFRAAPAARNETDA